jgi:hypothetical protein
MVVTHGRVGLAMAAAVWLIHHRRSGGAAVGLAILLLRRMAYARIARSMSGSANGWPPPPVGANLKVLSAYHLQHLTNLRSSQRRPELVGTRDHTVLAAPPKLSAITTGQTFYKQRINQFAKRAGLGLR